MKAFRHMQKHFHISNTLKINKLTRAIHIDSISNHSLEWSERAFPKLIKLTRLLHGLDLINGRLVNVENKRVVNDEFLMQNMHSFKSIGTTFVMQNMHTCANKPSYKESVSVNSLKKVCDILDISAQQRKLVRLAVCPQVTQHQIWSGALMEILNQLKYEMSFKEYGTKGDNMAQQIVVNCLKFLDDSVSYDPDSTSWMRIAPNKDADSSPSAKWEDLLEMFNDLINCLKNDRDFHFYVMKLETMKEGLAQIKDVLVDKNIAYKEARHQQTLVSKKLTKSLGHSSQCLFTLLLYYLYGSIRHIELDVCCWFSEDVDGDKFYLRVGKILTSDSEKMLGRAVKQLDMALGVIKFVHEMAEMKESLEVQGHLWSLGSENKSFAYRGHKFFIHGISLR